MKIAFVVPSLINKGPIIVVYNLVTFLKDRVEKIDVYYFDESPESTSLNFECNVFKISKSEMFEFNNYDIIHSHTLRADIYIYKWKKYITKAKIISTLHQDTFNMFSIRYNKIISFFLTNYWLFIQRKFSAVVAISDQLKNKYNSLLSNKITRIYNGCNISTYQVDEEIKNLILNYKNKGFKILGSYAQITSGKGLSQVIQILDSMNDYMYVIIGEGPYLKELKKQSIKLNVSNRVLFIPYIQFPYSYLDFIDIYMMPSYSEGFGLAMVEAALKKKAIVCSNIPAFNEIFDSTEVCFFNLDNKKSLINAIKIAYLNRHNKGDLAYTKANKNFTAAVMAQNHLFFYNKIINNIIT